mmetsp:Transcript_21643/g.53905  ORF Transcript_21643/g.53905 Transcript_21643/m.53905 type:complete len:221 (+) Transcript_21643:82-744(+)
MMLVQHMVNVIGKQAAEIAQLRAEITGLRAQIPSQARAAVATLPAVDEAATLLAMATSSAPAPPHAAAAAKRALEEGAGGDAQAQRYVVARTLPVAQGVAKTQPAMAWLSPVGGGGGEGGSGPPTPGGGRRCTICGTNNTPKWRHGNTLCNACGLRNAKQTPHAPAQPLSQMGVHAVTLAAAAAIPAGAITVAATVAAAEVAAAGLAVTAQANVKCQSRA